MTTTLRLVADQLVTPTDGDLAMVQRELGRALVASSPRGCEVAAIVPAGDTDPLARAVPGIADVTTSVLARRELAAAWQLGVAPGVGGGMIHAASLMAPLVRHDRVHDHDQTVVSLWDLTPWHGGAGMARMAVTWHKAMLKRAERHADAVVVPTHSMAAELREISKLGSRVRVIAGAAPDGFAEPRDAVGRRRTLDVPERFLLVDGGHEGALESASRAVVAAGLDVPVVITGAGEGREPAVADVAAAAGLPASHVHVRGALDAADRSALLGAAVAVLAPSSVEAYPWRVLEAMAMGVPVVAASSAVHREVVEDAGVVGADADSLAEGLAAVTRDAERYRVLSADRGRGFSWRVAADAVWALHAEL